MQTAHKTPQTAAAASTLVNRRRQPPPSISKTRESGYFFEKK
jgi:hypothetical protein